MKNAKGSAPPTNSNQGKPKQVVDETATKDTDIKPAKNKNNTYYDKTNGNVVGHFISS